jgi:hypothetical protein
VRYQVLQHCQHFSGAPAAGLSELLVSARELHRASRRARYNNLKYYIGDKRMEKFTLLIMPLNEGNFEEYKTDILPNLKNIADEYIQLFPGVFLFRTSSSSAVIHYFESWLLKKQIYFVSQQVGTLPPNVHVSKETLQRLKDFGFDVYNLSRSITI